jgi:hypothetical protein
VEDSVDQVSRLSPVQGGELTAAVAMLLSG